MMGLSGTHLILMVGIIVLLFGKGKISELMGDVGKGIKSFKRGLDDDQDASSLNRDAAAAPERIPASLQNLQPESDGR